MRYEQEAGWYLVSFNPKYHIYDDLFHLGQQFKLRRHWSFWGTEKVADHERDVFTVYRENGDIWNCMSRCQGEWIRISTRQEYELAKMVYPSIAFEVNYALLS